MCLCILRLSGSFICPFKTDEKPLEPYNKSFRYKLENATVPAGNIPLILDVFKRYIWNIENFCLYWFLLWGHHSKQPYNVHTLLGFFTAGALPDATLYIYLEEAPTHGNIGNFPHVVAITFSTWKSQTVSHPRPNQTQPCFAPRIRWNEVGTTILVMT